MSTLEEGERGFHWVVEESELQRTLAALCTRARGGQSKPGANSPQAS